ncbi:WD40-repeat-containing domain protein [Mycotypha africana]|uniref:WD40-repeat-containing domain protein n=1 Tax=Mycotypha africana TaxID=64632 RepID=UPI0023019891|nr:WD40-repeat-containing domain protein [Mycotypha africana]KAI8973292.1 WD40-repeat-containing domain protein [Mycotypha africana]
MFSSTALQKEIYCGIVTSLQFHNESILLAGHGPYLKIFNVKTGELLAARCILEANRIHRIVQAPYNFIDDNGFDTRKYALYGSKYLSLVNIKVKEKQAFIEVENSFGPFQDWIMDANWIYDDASRKDPKQMMLVYAHNFAEVYEFSSTTRELELIYSVQCETRCILYSARIYGHTMEKMIIASGTVFNEVHLWKPHVKNANNDAIVFEKLTGHEGVIFGLRFNEDGSQLASVSDDRTIRIWPLKEEKNKRPLVLFGHTARIWDCQFVNEYLVSISEDSTCRVWRNTLLQDKKDENDEDDGSCIACWEGHAVKNVWSCAINPTSKIVATGGQDSGIRLWSLTSVTNTTIDSDKDLIEFPLPLGREEDNIRNFAVIQSRWIIAVTETGYILKCDLHASLALDWREVEFDASYRNYAIMQNSECGRVVVIGNIVGELVFISPTDEFKPFKIAAHKQKLFEIFIKQSSDINVLYIISNGYNDSVLFHKLDLSESEPFISTLYNIEMPSERTTVMSLDYAEKESILICGSRESALVIYQLPLNKATRTNHMENVKPVLQLRKSHGKQAITSVLIKEPKDNSNRSKEGSEEFENEASLTFWTTGRDGCYIQYRLRTSDGTPTEQKYNEEGATTNATLLGVASRGDTVISGNQLILEKLYRNRVTKGTLEGSRFVNNELLLLGFFRKKFFVYNEKKNFNMLSVNCGGGHRRWNFYTEDAKLNKSVFAFIRKESLYAYVRNTSGEADGFHDSILQDYYHGREVRALCFLPISDAMVFATGGEDTILRIQQYIPSLSTIQTHVNIRRHTTVIKNIAHSPALSPSSFLLFTSGGLEELRAWKIESEVSKDSREEINLSCLAMAKCPTISEDIESRIMDTTVYLFQPGLHIVGAAYSDAMIRLWLFNEKTRKFSMVADGTWHAKCILQITHVTVNDHVYFVTSATDGKVAVWDIHEDLRKAMTESATEQIEDEPLNANFKLTKPVSYFNVHMSGVNALEIVPYKDEDHFLIFTGGEDNAVAVSLFNAKEQTLVKQPFIVANAHASSVTGIKYIHNVLITVSTDQRLNVWSIVDNDMKGITLSLIRAAYMDVPDPSALDAIIYNSEIHVATTGIGLQSVKIPLEEL